MFKKPVFWIIFAIIVVISSYICINNFGRIMSFINLEITMDRHSALQSAREDSKKWAVGPDSCRQAVIFSQDSYLQYYIELEAGGKDAYNDFINEGKYQPYYWLVRHFVPGEEHQAYFYYTPEGRFNGFVEEIPESAPGNNITVEAAQSLGEEAAAEMGVALSEFELIETHKDEMISGRMDYTFVYERPEKINEARYRFNIAVSGDKVSSLYYNMHVPQAFSRRFMEMRSANNTIASTSQYAMIFLYGLLGIGLGSFMLLRKRYLLYKNALLAAFIVSFLGFLAQFNQLPLSWIWYDTASSPQAHIMQNISMGFLQFLQDFFILALSFTAAESLTRLAFPNQVRFWKTLSAPVAPSKRILGNTLGGYGMVAINLLFVMGFYLFTESKFGWWNPAGLQVDPNFIAMPFPWLSVLSQALHAGFWEEALFRAIPLAGMILIGRRYNKEKLFLVIGLILQALIFSAGHANYAAQPAYARVVELIVPSMVFAFLYLRFGLYTGVILHFTYDAVLMAMYIWIMKAPGIWINRLLVIIGILLPLLIVLYFRLKNKTWVEIKEPFLNKHWKPAPPKPAKVRDYSPVSRSYNPRIFIWLLILSLCGALFWGIFTKFKADQPAMKITRAEAVQAAEDALLKQNITIPENWRTDARIINRITDADKLVWQSAGKEVYHNAVGEYLQEPLWMVAFRTFEGDVVERAEAYIYYINSRGEVDSYSHSIPEDRAGAELKEDEARLIAIKELQEFYDLGSFMLNEVQAKPGQRPERRDWVFVYRDTVNYLPEIGEYRYQVDISGDKVMKVSRYTYVPEEWSRTERGRTRPVQIFSSFAWIVYILLYVVIGIMGVVSWSGRRFNFKSFFYVLIVMLVTSLIMRFNNWQQIPAGFSTSEPWKNQVLQFGLGSITNVLLLSFVFALMAGYLGSWQNKVINKLRLHNAIWAGFIFAGFNALVALIKPDHLPFKPSLEFLGDFSPLIMVISKAVSSWISSSLIFIFLLQWLRDLSQNGQKKKFLTWLIFFFYVFIFKHSVLVYAQFADFAYLIVLSAVSALVLNWLFRQILVFDLTIAPVFLAVSASFPLLRSALSNNWSQAVAANIAAIVVINLLAYFWHKILLNSK